MKTKGRNEPRILIADDDASIRQLLTTIVKRERLIADSASDGEDAIRKLQEHEYSVILLDLMMPHVDGFGVIDYLREHPQSRDSCLRSAAYLHVIPSVSEETGRWANLPPPSFLAVFAARNDVL